MRLERRIALAERAHQLAHGAHLELELTLAAGELPLERLVQADPDCSDAWAALAEI